MPLLPPTPWPAISRTARRPPRRASRSAALLILAAIVAACGSSSTPTGTPPATGGSGGSPIGAASGAGPTSGASMPGAGDSVGPGLSPGSGASSSPAAMGSPSPTAPQATPTASATASPPPAGPASKFGYRAKGMTGEVLGFVQAGSLGYALQGLDYDVVSTIAFFSLVGLADGSLNRNNPAWRAWTSPQMSQVIEKAHAAGTRVVLSLQGFSWSPNQTAVSSAILASAATRERLASQTAAEVVRRGVDGVDVDFEPIPPGQATEFTDFVRRLRADLDRSNPNYQLTVAVVGHYDSYDIPGLIASGGADAIYLMGYHWAGWWSTAAGSTAPYGGGGYDVKAAIAGLLESVPPDRLIVGVPYYGHLWPTTSSSPRSRTTGEGVDLIYTDALAVAQANGLKHEPTQDSAWSVFRSRDCATCALHWNQLYFDDATSLAHKWAYMRDLGLLGTGVWTLPFEGAGGGPLDAAMRKAFLAAP